MTADLIERVARAMWEKHSEGLTYSEAFTPEAHWRHARATWLRVAKVAVGVMQEERQ